MKKPTAPHLRVVEPPAPKPEMPKFDLKLPNTQGSLFASHSASLLVFCDLDLITDYDIINLINSAKPRNIIDLRIAPRFDIGSLNRKIAFSLFETHNAKYFDIAGIIKFDKTEQNSLYFQSITDAINNIIKSQSAPLGPICIFGNTNQLQGDFADLLAAHLDSSAETGWEVLRIPETLKARLNDRRSTVFISHATPNDNDFVRWLSTQLQLIGYQVWTDIDRLVGGENFWDEIEDVIRNKAAKVIVAASRVAQTKDGVLDEINLAVSVERSTKISNFVVPLRIDDLPFDQFRANIARRNIINFTENWANGLANVIKLLERDGVPREANKQNFDFAYKLQGLSSERGIVSEIEEALTLNWIEVLALPNVINSYSISAPSGKIATIGKTLQVPHVLNGDRLLSFASPDRFQEALPLSVTGKRTSAMLTSEFISASDPSLSKLTRGEARKVLSNLFRQGWNHKARERGLLPYELASRSVAWFAPTGLIPNEKVAFVDPSGKKRRKSLVGYSAKRKVYWHFAMEFRLVSGSNSKIVCRSHVVFSEDGKTPISSSTKMHALRRGFCKTWWNDRWRDLSIAFLHWLSGETNCVDIDMGCRDKLVFSSKYMTAICPVSIAEPTQALETDISDSEEGDDELEPDIDELEMAQINSDIEIDIAHLEGDE